MIGSEVFNWEEEGWRLICSYCYVCWE